MNTATLHASIQALEKKIKQLLTKVVQLQTENERLKQNNTRTFTGDPAQIDQYIQKIDLCIAHLEQLQ